MIDQEQTRGVSIQISRRSFMKAIGLSSLAIITATEGASGYNFPPPRPVPIPQAEIDPITEYYDYLGKSLGRLAGAVIAPAIFLYGVYKGEWGVTGVAKRWSNTASGFYTAAGALGSFFLGRIGGELIGHSVGKVAGFVVNRF